MKNVLCSLVTCVLVLVCNTAFAGPCPESLSGVMLDGERVSLDEARELIATGDDAIYQQARVHYARTPGSCLADVVSEARKRNDTPVIRIATNRGRKAVAWADCYWGARGVGYPVGQPEAVDRLREDFDKFWRGASDHPWASDNPYFTCPLDMSREERVRFYTGWWKVSGVCSDILETPEEASVLMADMVERAITGEEGDPLHFMRTSVLPNCF